MVAGGVDHRKHLVAFMHGGDGRERQAHAGQGAGDHQGFLAGGFDRRVKLRVVPGIDFAFARHVLRMGCGLVDFRDQRPVRSLRNRGSGNHRHFQQGRGLGQGNGVGAQLGHVHVLDDLEQSALVIDQQHCAVIGVDGRFLAVEVGRVDSVHVRFLFLLGNSHPWPENRPTHPV
ncbi:hypothetical protein D3C78_1400920 [compost metagenome]